MTPRLDGDDDCVKAEWVVVDEENQRSLTESADGQTIGRTGSDSPKVGRTGSDSPKVGHTGSDSPAAIDGADKFTLPPSAKLEPFTPPRAKTSVREDSVPPEEHPAKRVRFEEEDVDAATA